MYHEKGAHVFTGQITSQKTGRWARFPWVLLHGGGTDATRYTDWLETKREGMFLEKEIEIGWLTHGCSCGTRITCGVRVKSPKAESAGNKNRQKNMPAAWWLLQPWRAVTVTTTTTTTTTTATTTTAIKTTAPCDTSLHFSFFLGHQFGFSHSHWHMIWPAIPRHLNCCARRVPRRLGAFEVYVLTPDGVAT